MKFVWNLYYLFITWIHITIIGIINFFYLLRGSPKKNFFTYSHVVFPFMEININIMLLYLNFWIIFLVSFLKKFFYKKFIFNYINHLILKFYNHRNLWLLVVERLYHLCPIMEYRDMPLKVIIIIFLFY
jgi:hypothetical protein